MKNLILLILMVGSASVLAGKNTKLFESHCKGKEVPYKRLKKACKSGKYAGQIIVKCKKKCKKRGLFKCKKRGDYEQVRQRVCNIGGERKGFYIESCAGTKLSARNMKSACSLPEAKGKTVVKCIHGKQTRKLPCSSSANNSATKMKTRIFLDKCGGVVAKYNGKEIKRNFKKACKNTENHSSVLVRCRNVCVQKKGLGCAKWMWKEKKRASCLANGKADKMKKCNEQESANIKAAIHEAQKEMPFIIQTMKAFINNPEGYYSSNSGNDFNASDKSRALEFAKKSLPKAEKVLKKLNSLKSKFVCEGLSKYCGKGTANAHTMQFRGANIGFCDGYLGMGMERQASVMVHELSHNFGTDDIEYSRTKIKDVDWWNNAETYEMWMDRDRFCVPGYEPNCR